MNIANIKRRDISNGPGVRVSVFVSGCRIHCPQCFNKCAWDFNYGDPYTQRIQDQILNELKPYFIKGISILGGQPMEPENRDCLIGLIKRIRNELPDKDVWIYTGYTIEQLDTADYDEILSLADVIVDGAFVSELKDISLRFRGSRNQRLIDMRKTMQTHIITTWTDQVVYDSHDINKVRESMYRPMQS